MELKLNLTERQIHNGVKESLRCGFVRPPERKGKDWTEAEMAQAVEFMINLIFGAEPKPEIEL